MVVEQRWSTAEERESPRRGRGRRFVWGRIGWVVCCGLLRLGRDSSAPATGGGFSWVPRGVPPREDQPYTRASERDGRREREREKEKGETRGRRKEGV